MLSVVAWLKVDPSIFTQRISRENRSRQLKLILKNVFWSASCITPRLTMNMSILMMTAQRVLTVI